MYFRRYDLGGKDSVDATAFAYAEKKKPITNADRIRTMTDEELATHLSCQWAECKNMDVECNKCLLDWLKEEAVSDG